MNKAIILTRSPIDDFEKNIINEASCLKIAINKADYISDFRIFHDSVYYKWYLDNYSEPLITSNLHYKEIKKENKLNKFFLFYEPTSNIDEISINKLYCNFGTLTPAINFLIKIKIKKILLVAMNNVYSKNVQNGIIEDIGIFSKFIKIYKYREDSNFNIEFKNIKDFCNE